MEIGAGFRGRGISIAARSSGLAKTASTIDRMTGARDAPGLVGQEFDKLFRLPRGDRPRTATDRFRRRRKALCARHPSGTPGRPAPVASNGGQASAPAPICRCPIIRRYKRRSALPEPAGRPQDRNSRLADCAIRRLSSAGARSTASRRHLGADRGAKRHEERQRGDAVAILATPRRGKISVQDHIGRAIQAAFDQIHEQKRQIVKHVARGDDGIEFQRVERDGLAVDNRDIAEMKVAVAAADQARGAARGKQRTQSCQGHLRISLKLGIDCLETGPRVFGTPPYCR